MISYKKALEIIQKKIPYKSHTKIIPLLDSIKHVSAQDVFAISSLPLTDVSLKDGYALRKDDKYEVSTGDNLQEGTLAVIPFEEELSETFELDYNVKKAGEDIQQGEPLLLKGEYINANNITPLASQGIQKIKVYKRPRVSILSIGNNLCPIQKEKTDFEVYNSNALTFAARILEIGASVHKVWQAKNDKKDILECLDELTQKSDLVITTGAMSKHDAMNTLLSDERFEILFHKVQISPASPSALSVFQQTPLLHLPGLPLSALLGFEALGIPVLKTIKNETFASKKSLHVKNKKEFTCKESCTSIIPGYFDGISFLSAPSFGAGMLNVLAKCNGYVIVEDKQVIKEREKVEFFPF